MRTLDLFEEEKSFSSEISEVIKVFVTPLMDARGIIIKDLYIKDMFEDLTKIHSFPLVFIDAIRMDLKMYKTEASLERGVLGLVENLVLPFNA